jgi:tetratricopeptide (TPR) repeat protein
MTIEPEVNPEKRFVPIFLPWLIAAGALTLYLITLNPWVSFGNLLQVSRMSGWSWQPELFGPLFWLVTYPLRWLPPQHIPLALNLFSCLCAALTLALLARSVALLPQDRTNEQRLKLTGDSPLLTIRSAWLPPLLAVLVCGLQLTFWEDATATASQTFTNGSSEMFDLLLFAYIVRCLLEYRLDWRESWLVRAALVYGAAVTNNWAMIGFFPALLAALIWIQGLSFFNIRFLTRLGLCVLVGLSLYLLLPLAQGLTHGAHIPFWPALKINLAAQKNIVVALFKNGRQTLLLLSLTSLLPMLIIGIRWSSYFGDTSEMGATIAKFMFHVIHALFLVACVWVALDPPFSPRKLGMGGLFTGIPFLTFYYLGALSVGYFSGYFLLIFSDPKPTRLRRPGGNPRMLNNTVTAAVWLLLILAPAALLYRNWPSIRTTNGPMLHQYAALLAKGLPAHNAVLLSDDASRALLMQSYAAQSGNSKNYIVLDTESLKYPEYHRFLSKQYAKRWPAEIPKDLVQPFPPIELVQMVFQLMQTNAIYYLHPSFGYYFEYFSSEPHGLVYRLLPCPGNVLLAPRLSAKLEAENNEFWAEAEPLALKPLEAALHPAAADQKPGFVQQLISQLHLTKEPSRTASLLAAFYSRSLDYWGVELQKEGRLTNAAGFFDRAVDLNPENIVAHINLECNKNLQAGRKGSVQLSKDFGDEFGKYRSWDAVVGANGPFDEPSFCFEQGRVFVRNNLHRQAAQEFDRVKTLAPDNLAARFWLAQIYVLSRLPSEALKLVDEIRADGNLASAAETNQSHMLFVEASAHLTKGDLDGAQKIIQNALKKSPTDEGLLATATQVYMSFQLYSNALATIDQHLKIAPTNLVALVNKGYTCIQVGAYQDAIEPLIRVIEADKYNYAARLNLAIASLRCDQLETAQQSYEVLHRLDSTDHRVYFGLQEIAWRKHNTNAVIQNCELYLANANTNTAEAKAVIERLKTVRGRSP